MSQEVLIGLIVGGIILIVLIVWFVLWCKSFCPSCRKAWGKQVVETILLDSRLDTRQHLVTNTIRNSKGEVVETITRPTTKIVTVKTFQDDCRCKHCGHEWSYTYTQET